LNERTTVAEAIGRTLATAGARHVFGVVGSGNFFMTNALINAGVTFTATRHEMGASCMADAHSRLTESVTIATVHQGGGYLNSLSGVLEAVKSHSRLLVLAGDVARGDYTSNFYLDQDRVAGAVGAVAIRVHSAELAVKETARAYHTAFTERRPVVLSVPIDVQEELIEWNPDDIPAAPAIVPAGASSESVGQLVDAIMEAERPVIVAGRGARGAKSELCELAEAAGALLVTSAGARGLFVGEEWALDVMGGFATPGAAELIEQADLLVAFGASLNKWTARGGVLTANKRIVQVDDRVEAIGKHTPVELGVLGDCPLVAQAATGVLRERSPEGRTGYRTDETHAQVQKVRYWVDQEMSPRGKTGLVDPAELTKTMDQLLPLERVVVPDGGNVNAYSGAFFRVPDENGYVIDLGSQSIGLGLAEGIGAAVARPDRLPLVATGDGSFMMGHVELDTAVRLGLGLLVLVYNDDAYGAEVHIFSKETQKETVLFPDTDIAAIARSYGCEAITVREMSDLAPLREWLDGPRDKPFVIDAKIEGFPSPVMELDMH